MSTPRPTVQLTRPTVVVLAIVVGAGLTWIVLSLADGFGWPLPPVPALAAVVVGVLAVLTGLAARWAHRTIQVDRDAVEPNRAVGLLLAGKAALIGGAALAGGYAAVAVRYLPDLGAQAPRDRVITAAIIAVLSVALSVAGRYLERACQIPPDDDSGDAPGADHRPAPSPG